jgi:hypothetical protein
MFFEHLGYDNLRLSPFQHRHQSESAGQLLGYPDMNGGKLDCLARFHTQRAHFSGFLRPYLFDCPRRRR